MKLIIQIPCFNEAETLPQTYRDLPKQIPGIDQVETLVIDDGSTDNTSDVAVALGVDHVIRIAHNTGLANAFSAGLLAALSLGADIVVNTDGDNQYQGGFIPALIRPIVEEGYDIVIGMRDFAGIQEFSLKKRFLQKLGSRIVQQLAGTRIPDATSGFRAFSRRALLRLNILSSFSYTLETIIQAKKIGLFVTSVPIKTNPQTRPSRLFSSTRKFIYESVLIIGRVYLRYEPLRIFLLMSLIPFVAGSVLWVRFVYIYISNPDVQTGHVQSLLIGLGLFVLAFFLVTLGLLGDLLQTNRQLLEGILAHLREMNVVEYSHSQQQNKKNASRGYHVIK